MVDDAWSKDVRASAASAKACFGGNPKSVVPAGDRPPPAFRLLLSGEGEGRGDLEDALRVCTPAEASALRQRQCM